MASETENEKYNGPTLNVKMSYPDNPDYTYTTRLTRLNLDKEREKDILLQRFMIGKTQMEIADEMGISQAQVSRLEKSAIINVRKLIK